MSSILQTPARLDPFLNSFEVNLAAGIINVSSLQAPESLPIPFSAANTSSISKDARQIIADVEALGIEPRIKFPGGVFSKKVSLKTPSGPWLLSSSSLFKEGDYFSSSACFERTLISPRYIQLEQMFAEEDELISISCGPGIASHVTNTAYLRSGIISTTYEMNIMDIAFSDRLLMRGLENCLHITGSPFYETTFILSALLLGEFMGKQGNWIQKLEFFAGDPLVPMEVDYRDGRFVPHAPSPALKKEMNLGVTMKGMLKITGTEEPVSIFVSTGGDRKLGSVRMGVNISPSGVTERRMICPAWPGLAKVWTLIKQAHEWASETAR
jgi:hypothetical protein